MNSMDSDPEPSAAMELTFPDSTDPSYPDPTDVGVEDGGASSGDLRDQLVTPEPNLEEDKRGFDISRDAPDTCSSNDFPNPPFETPVSNDNPDEIDEEAKIDSRRDVFITPTAFKSLSIDLSSNLLGQISTDDSGFCVSTKQDDDDDDKAKNHPSADEQDPEKIWDNYVNGNGHLGDPLERYDAEEPSPKTNVVECSHVTIEATETSATGDHLDPKDFEFPFSTADGDPEIHDPNSTSLPPSSTPPPHTSTPDLPSIEDDPSASDVPRETTDQPNDNYMDSNVINDVDDDSAADAEVRKVDSETGQAEEPPRLDPEDWRQFPLVFFDKEEEKRLRASISDENAEDEASRSRHASSARSTPEVPVDDEVGTRPSTPNWSTDGSNVLETFDDLINLLPCDLRGWAIHKSDCENVLVLVHSVVQFKTLELKSDVMVVFERERQKLKKSSYNLPKDPPLDRSTRHLLDDARGSRGRSASTTDESYPDSKNAESPRWNYLVKYMSSGLTNKLSGPRRLNLVSLCAILRFALRSPTSLKRKYCDAEVDEIIEEEMKRPRRTTSSPAPNLSTNNASQASGSMLECFKCKNLVSMEMWSEHPCFKQAVYRPNIGPKRGGGGGNKNDLFCKYCKLRFKDTFALKGHEIKFPGGSCNMVINCSICKRKFTSRGSYAIHLQGAEGKKCKKGMFRCQVCKSFWADDLELIDHFRKSHPCTKCRFQPNTYEDYDAHSRSCFRPNVPSYPPNHFATPSPSNASGSQSCRHCLLIFRSPAELAVHLRTSRACGEAVKMPSTHSKPAVVIKCQQCRKTFQTNQELVDHMRRWHNQQTYLHRCVFCPKNFATAEMLKAHCSKVHGNTGSSGVGATSYDCKVCSLKFISFSGLSRHLKMKHGIRGGNQNANPKSGGGGDGGGGGGGGGGCVNDVAADRNFQSRAPASSVEIDVSAVSTPVTLDFKNFPTTSCSSSPLPSENKTLSDKDFLFGDDPVVSEKGGGAGEGGDSYKCGNCFLFFDDPTDFKQHCASCK